MTDSTASPEMGTTSPRPRPFAWIAGAVACVALSAAVCVNLPDRIKLLGLFPLIWAGLMGIGLRWWADEVALSIRGWPTAFAVLLIMAGEVGMVLGGWLTYRAQILSKINRTPSFGMENRVESQQSTSKEQTLEKPEAAEARRQLELEFDVKIQERRNVQMRLTTYLYRRIVKLGDWSSPWPEVFWGCEIVFGGLAGMWCLKNGSLVARG